MRVFRKVLLATYLLSGLLALSQSTTWKEYVYGEDGFSVSSPVKPVLAKRTMKPAAGEVEAHFYFIPLENCQLMLMYAPLHPNDKRTSDQALQDARKGISLSGAKLLSEKTISLGSYPGIQLESDDGEHRQLGRFYAVDRRMYTLVADVPTGKQFPAEAQQWFESFRLIEAKK